MDLTKRLSKYQQLPVKQTFLLHVIDLVQAEGKSWLIVLFSDVLTLFGSFNAELNFQHFSLVKV